MSASDPRELRGAPTDEPATGPRKPIHAVGPGPHPAHARVVPTGDAYHYQGDELELFALARHWKSYIAAKVQPLLSGRVLEVGAGIGGTSRLLVHEGVAEWVCLEPDPAQCEQIRGAVKAGKLPSTCVVREGTLADVAPDERFDAIVYIDVLEHIAADRAELARASALLHPRGRLVVLSPAHQALFTALDTAFGHHRRYSRTTLRALRPPGLRLESIQYMDSIGLLASVANRLFLRSPAISLRQLRLWDDVMVPLSRRVDPLLGGLLGKSVLAVWSAPR